MDKLFAAISLFVASLLFPQTPIRTQHRSVLLDCGRKYYTRDWILDLLEEMEDCHANELVLHFSDDMGLRLESKTYPWLAGSDNAWSLDPSVPDPDPGKVLTQEDILVIGRAASDRGIELIPSFDSPGHMRYILERYREQTGQDIAMSFAPSCLVITNCPLPDGGIRPAVCPDRQPAV
ncbi:family 20 glycosylhydrolase [Faecalibaculum rodentium]|uniref:family 20 glycosylhydrolase n=1 Tax=Faecalibaculum rodentium TaxID=1702221 RepID=UPI00256F0201|nr:family 20 glycosylhydrolase [Faecalibaculum rodentium]